MPGSSGPIGSRPRWPDLVIALAFLALTGAGVAALFGPAIRGWLGTEPPTATTPVGPAGGAAM